MENNQEIAKIAYELYLLRGGAPGDPIADWITAERIYAERNAQRQSVRTIQENVLASFEVGGTVVEPMAETKPRSRKAPAKVTAVKEAQKAQATTSAARIEKKLAEVIKPKKVSRKKSNGAAE